MTRVEQCVIDFVEDICGPSPFEIGDIVSAPDGRKIKIVSGHYWGAYGLSNFWSWQEVLPDGSLSPTIESGYGWRS